MGEPVRIKRTGRMGWIVGRLGGEFLVYFGHTEAYGWYAEEEFTRLSQAA